MSSTLPDAIKGLLDLIAPGYHYVKLTKANADFADGLCKGLWVGTAGTGNIVDASGANCADFPLLAGYNPIACVRLSTGGTADDIWAIYSEAP